MCHALVAARYDVTVVGLRTPDRPDTVRPWRTVTYGRASRSRVRRLVAQVKLAVTLRSENPDVVQFHDPELLPLMLFLAGRGGKKRRIIYDMHEDVAASLADRGLPNVVTRVYKYLLRMAEDRIAIILAEDCYRDLTKDQWPILHNYPLTAQMPERSRRQQVVYVGDVAVGRGAFHMVRAFALSGLDSWQLAIVGPCNEAGAEAALAREAAQLGLGGRFLRVHRVPPGEVAEWLAVSSIGMAILQRQRNYVRCPPGKVFEYVQSCLPAIVSDFPEYRRCFGELPSITFVDPADVEGVAHALRDLASQLPKLSAKCQQSRAIALAKFVFDHEGARLSQMIEALLSATGKEGRLRFRIVGNARQDAE